MRTIETDTASIIATLLEADSQRICELWNMGDISSADLDKRMTEREAIIQQLRTNKNISNMDPQLLASCVSNLITYVRTFINEANLPELEKALVKVYASEAHRT